MLVLLQVDQRDMQSGCFSRVKEFCAYFEGKLDRKICFRIRTGRIERWACKAVLKALYSSDISFCHALKE